VQKQLQEEAADRSSNVELRAQGWRYSYGWLIVLVAFPHAVDNEAPYGGGGGYYKDKHYRHAATYQEAVRLRDDELASGHYQYAWIHMKTASSAKQM
jgi:hypothetical protein